MPAKHFIVKRSVQKNLLKLPVHIHKRIIQALGGIKQNPIAGAKLKGELGDYYKICVGDYRIVYSFDAKQSIVNVVKIEHRQGVYR